MENQKRIVVTIEAQERALISESLLTPRHSSASRIKYLTALKMENLVLGEVIQKLS
jgi:hypothetical protein